MDYLGSNVRRILQFLQVVEAGSINRAALNLGLTQPALTRSIHTLEQTLGLLLLDRSAKGVVATLQGERLLEHARVLKADLARAALDIEEMASNRNRMLRVGVTSGVCWITTRAIDRLANDGACQYVKAIEGHTANLVAQLKISALDLVICPVDRELDALLRQQWLFRQNFCLWVNAAHPLLQRRKLTLGDLVSADWILPLRESVSSTRIRAALELAGASISGSIIECSSHLMILEMLSRTNRIAFMSEMALDVAARSNVITRLTGDFAFEPQNYACYLAQDVDEAKLETFLMAIRTEARSAGLELTLTPQEVR